MTRTVSRTFDDPHTAPGGNVTEVTTGDAPSSIELSLTAKGQLQWSVKLYYDTPDAMLFRLDNDLKRVDIRVKTFADEQGYTLAGK